MHVEFENQVFNNVISSSKLAAALHSRFVVAGYMYIEVRARDRPEQRQVNK